MTNSYRLRSVAFVALVPLLFACSSDKSSSGNTGTGGFGGDSSGGSNNGNGGKPVELRRFNQWDRRDDLERGRKLRRYVERRRTFDRRARARDAGPDWFSRRWRRERWRCYSANRRWRGHRGRAAPAHASRGCNDPAVEACAPAASGVLSALLARRAAPGWTAGLRGGRSPELSCGALATTVAVRSRRHRLGCADSEDPGLRVCNTKRPTERVATGTVESSSCRVHRRYDDRRRCCVRRRRATSAGRDRSTRSSSQIRRSRLV